MSNTQNIRIRFFADTHLGFDYPIRPRIVRRRRGKDFFDNFKFILDSAHEAKIDLLVHGGDLFFRSRIPSKIVDLAYEALFDFAQKGIPLLIVPGNHERSRLPASLYLAHPNIYVFVKPETYVFAIKGLRICFSGFPFERRNIKDRFQSVLDETGWKDCKGDLRLLCIHQAVEGAQVGPANYTFRNGDDVIRLGDIPHEFDAVLAGHIHRSQILNGQAYASGKDTPVVYPGSTERTSFAEKDEEKGFFDLTFPISSSAGRRCMHAEFISLPSRPMVDLYLKEDINENHLESYLLANIKHLDKDAIVRIKCMGSAKRMIRQKLTASFLRRVFPASMNVYLATEFYISGKDRTER